MRPTFFHQPPRPRIHLRMCMWGDMIPKRGQAECLARIAPDALELLGSAADHMFAMVLCSYVGLDWRGCPNILFTVDEPPNDRGNIRFLFKLIQFHFSVLLN